MQRNEPDSIILSTAVSKAVGLRFSMMDNDEIISNPVNVASLLREMMSKRGWSFTGTFHNFENPALLQFFVSHLLLGSHVDKAFRMCDEEMNKTADVAYQSKTCVLIVR